VGFLDRLRDGLSRTKQQIVDRFDEIVQQADARGPEAREIDVDTVEALEELLISADVGVAATEQIVTAVRSRARRGESLRDLVKREIRSIFDAVDGRLCQGRVALRPDEPVLFDGSPANRPGGPPKLHAKAEARALRCCEPRTVNNLL